VRAILQACVDLGIDVIAEGVETAAEYQWFLEANVRYFQGYLFAKPGMFSCPIPGMIRSHRKRISDHAPPAIVWGERNCRPP